MFEATTAALGKFEHPVNEYKVPSSLHLAARQLFPSTVLDQLQSVNVAFHRPRAPGQGECSPYRCLITLQLYHEVMGEAMGGPPCTMGATPTHCVPASSDRTV
jgi:hypothetical protein